MAETQKPPVVETTAPPVPPSAQVGDKEMNSDGVPASTVVAGEEFNPGYLEPEEVEGQSSVPTVDPFALNEATKFGYVNVSREYQRFTGPEAIMNPDVPTSEKSKTIPSE